MPTYLTPGVYLETVDASRAQIASLRTDIAAFVGIAERGALHRPTRVESWEQFQSGFGNFSAGGYLAYAAKAFFEQGGRTAYIVRVAARPRTITDAAVPQPLSGTDSFVESVEGFRPGAFVLVTQPPHRKIVHALQNVDAPTRKLSWTRPLEPGFNFAQAIAFETGALAARVELPDANGVPTLRVLASSAGSWGNALQVRVAHTNLASTRTRSAPQPADKKSSLVESVAQFPAGALVKVFQEHAPAPWISHHIVKRVDAVRGALEWLTPLPAVFNLAKPIYFETIEFAVTAYLGGQPRELFTGLSLVKNHPRYASRTVQRDASNLIRLTNLHSPSSPVQRLPEPGIYNLQWGQDGLTPLTLRDFIGDPGAEAKWGLRTLEDVDLVAIVAMPDVLIQPAPPVQFAPQPPPAVDPCLLDEPPLPVTPPPMPVMAEQPPTFSRDEVFFAQAALVAHCEDQRDRIAVLDPPFEADPGEIMAWRQRFDSKYAALYYPWLLVKDPLRLGRQIVRQIPPSGHVVGVYAATDREVGVHQAPANRALRWAQDVAASISPELQGALNPLGVNCIRSLAGRGLRVYGARTVSSDTAWRFVNVRRLMMMIEEAVAEAIQWAVFEPNDFALRQTITLAITSYLRVLWQRGALAGATEAEAFYVKCDAQNNNSAVVDVGQLIAEVGVAPTIPAEFVIVRVGRTDNTLEVVE